mmetsp:Transcript_2430/g.5791  ORF Transcript_2430/g.5791 Transcript_2430/m.5791 type:complete len:214 (+) Transcript_2430:2-643(+)
MTTNNHLKSLEYHAALPLSNAQGRRARHRSFRVVGLSDWTQGARVYACSTCCRAELPCLTLRACGRTAGVGVRSWSAIRAYIRPSCSCLQTKLSYRTVVAHGSLHPISELPCLTACANCCTGRAVLAPVACKTFTSLLRERSRRTGNADTICTAVRLLLKSSSGARAARHLQDIVLMFLATSLLVCSDAALIRHWFTAGVYHLAVPCTLPSSF